ncbi:MAG TPA: tRNA (N6-isopentenyl adenosine(37)-C2)-methylthiotransferase MiaB [Thermodesulfobacteriota bacterium]|nr:tRNA (N6-isopentenyl adenosine(37)-C2)-methylthiotransferase MiaB [Thermodesulfobacteriota bacterium]
MRKRYLYIETYGCQMNEYDSDRIRNAIGIETTDDPEEADVVIINTCSIREKADQKALSSLGRFKHLKSRKPNVVVGIAGCVAQLYGERLLDRIPHLDFVLGPRAIPRLPQIISQVERERRRSVETSLDIEEVFEIEPYHEEGRVTAFVSIQQGCNKRCTYCIVPYVRGEEVNRPLEDILRETKNLVQKGVKEVTLIGQTVNSWRMNGYRFGDLLRMVAEIEGLLRIRFTTSYPRDVTKRMIEAMKGSPKVCRHIHLPVQSGSNRVLASMGRTYTREWYIDTVNRLRDAIPDIAVSTDIIVGFPGETREDFNDTMGLVREVQFDGVFSFKYSPRPGTTAAGFSDMVPDEVASERLAELQEVQREITLKKNLGRVGQIEEVLVEGESKNDTNWVSGRTTHNRIVNFPGNDGYKGKIVSVMIKEGFQNSLRGELVENI